MAGTHTEGKIGLVVVLGQRHEMKERAFWGGSHFIDHQIKGIAGLILIFVIRNIQDILLIPAIFYYRIGIRSHGLTVHLIDDIGGLIAGNCPGALIMANFLRCRQLDFGIGASS